MQSGPRVAVLGAGMQGASIALELARRGCAVDLFDQAALPITGAGLQNEGKLHLGFLWARDATLETANLVAAGSLRFFSSLRRWIGPLVDQLPRTAPFVYAVPHDSMIAPDLIYAYQTRVEMVVQRQATEALAEGVSAEDIARAVRVCTPVAPLELPEFQRWFNPERVLTAHRTPEIAVDPDAVARVLRQAITADEQIRFHLNTRVTGVEPRGCHYQIVTNCRASDDQYDQVVNALWDGRLPIDLALGLQPEWPWLWRAKRSLRIPASIGSFNLPTVTWLLGPYGDMTDYRNGFSYLSWYPAGLLGISSELAPPGAWQKRTSSSDAMLIADTLRALAELSPGVARLPTEARAQAEVIGGSIFGYGECDIHHADSGLHRRSLAGARCVDGYHSVDPGKYCLAPWFAVQVADCIVEDTA